MSSSSAASGFGGVPARSAKALERDYDISGLWWLWLVTGIAWVGASVVILQFDGASITTVGVIVGIMFIASGIQQLTMAVIGESARWVWGIFGALFVIAGVVCLFSPEDTFAGMADMLGFLFLLVGVWWAIRALMQRSTDSLWWLGLVAAVLMLAMAFWTGGAFFIQKAYVLLVFSGIWALMQGVIDIVRAFQVRSLGRAD
jgi:uncharacterized membrane protein HdeD (DUF308 family)